MKKLNLNKAGTALIKIYKSVKEFRFVFTKTEKIAVALLCFVALFSLFFWTKEIRSRNQYLTYTEGWLTSDSRKTLDLGRLTSAGLTRNLKDGAIGADIADKWQVSDDRLTYTFTIKSQFSSKEILEALLPHKEDFGSAEISAPNDKTIQFKLKQPLNYFLQATTKPILPYGPYSIETQTKQNLVLTARKQYHLTIPPIKRVIIKFYKNEKELERALKTGKVMATVDLSKDVLNFKTQRVSMPRYISLFINTRNEPYNNRDLREKIVKKQPVTDKKLKARFKYLDVPEVSSFVDSLKKRFESQGIELTTEAIHPTKLEEVLKKRDFDFLLMGIDYGYGEDLYPYWHSSQVKYPGNNFVGIQNKDLDIKLEEARLTEDMNLRQEKIKEAKDIINSEFAEIPLKAEMMIYQSSSKLKNNELKFLSEPLDRFNYISDWTIE